ncbi:Ankyrin repeat and LEM domain-containing protein 1 [Nymphon striatum]|nr:Ankyrin repeat and LEM domain-containing protein 1 [Nymphon striatum]
MSSSLQKCIQRPLICARLIDIGVDVNAIVEDGFSCLHKIVGIVNNHDETLPILQVMLQNGGNPNVRSAHGLTPVHISTMWGQLEALKLLIKFEGDPSLLDYEGKDAYALAEENSEKEIMVYLDFLRLTEIVPNISNFEKISPSEHDECSAKSDDSWCNPSNFYKIKNREYDINLDNVANKDLSETCNDDDAKDIGFIASPSSCTSNDSFVTKVNGNIHSLDDVESVHYDEYTKTELVECLSSCCPSIISVNTSDLDKSDETEIYDWRSYRSKKSNNDDMQQLIMKSMAGGDNEQMTKLLLPAYSKELELFLSGFSTNLDTHYNELEAEFCNKFENPTVSTNWREGIVKSAFNYLLLDSRHTKNLPNRALSLESEECFKIFISSIFYIGKGTHSRPYCHLYDAMHKVKHKLFDKISQKEQHILDIWDSGNGVISLHCFQNIIPAEALTREALMIDSIVLQNLTNIRKGNYNGDTTKWSTSKKCMLGAYFLHKAFRIFLIEGERQLFPVNIKT